jgi:hypothetical protein
MILVYTTLLFALVVAAFAVKRRAGYLEKKFARVSRAVQTVALEPTFKPGSRLDACQIAKRQLQLGVLVQKRDRVEAKYLGWQALADKFNGWVGRLQGWKGKKLPYTFGVVDVSCLLYAVDYLGVGRYVNVMELWHWATSLIAN